MEEVASNTYGDLVNGFADDLVHTNFPTTTAPIFLPEEPIQVQSFPGHQDENGRDHKAAENGKPVKIAAYWQQECRPWLKQIPLGHQANSCYKAKKEKPKIHPPAVMKKDTATALYHKVMDEVANKTHGAFLKHYGDDSVYVQFQELWTLKMMNKKVKPGRVAGNFHSAGVATPLHDLNPPYKSRREECGSGTSTQEKAPSQTTASIPLPGESIQFQCLPDYQDGNGTNSKSAAYMKLGKVASCKQQPRRPWLRNAGFEKAQPKFKLQHPAKEQVHQPWLKQKPFGNQENGGLEEARRKSLQQPPAMVSFTRNSSNEVHAETSFEQPRNSDIDVSSNNDKAG